VSDRRADAAATLVRLGLDPDAIAAGRLTAADLAPRLAGDGAAALVGAIADLGTRETAALLVALEPAAADRGVRKEIRRSLYRLRQRGVPVPEPERASEPARPVTGATPEGLVSTFDAVGDRIVWLVRPLPGGGVLLVDGLVNEPAGLREVHVAEMSRKQLRTIRQRVESGTRLRLVAADWHVVDALLVEGHERARSGERERDYLRVRARITTEPPRPAAEPVSTHVAPPSEDEAAALVARSASLLEEPEFGAWYPSPDAVAPFVEEIGALRESPLVVSPVAQEERVREVLRRATVALFPPAVLARWMRGTAYVLAERARTAPARMALAVSRTLETQPAAHEIPFVTALVERSVGTVLAEKTARDEQARRSALVVTPGQFLKDRSSSRPGRTRG
jgi:hypothetical protein